MRLGLPRRKFSSAARCSGVAVGEISAVSRSRRSNDVFPVPWLPTTYDASISELHALLYTWAHTMMLNVVGARALRRLSLGRAWLDLRVSKEDGGGGVDMYKEEMGPPAGLPGDDHGTWNGMGPCTSESKSVLAAPFGGVCGASGTPERSTRCSGHGIPCELSCGSEGE